MDLFFNNNFENIFNIELLSIRIENTSRLKIFNPWTLRGAPLLDLEASGEPHPFRTFCSALRFLPEKSPVLRGVCVCVEHLNRCKTSSAVLVCRGQWPTHESTANEATHELGGYRD